MSPLMCARVSTLGQLMLNMLLREAVEGIWKEHIASNESRKREIFGKGPVLRKDVKLILSGKIEDATDILGRERRDVFSLTGSSYRKSAPEAKATHYASSKVQAARNLH
jgi:hypothetical protein